MLDRTAELARIRAEEYKWRTALAEIIGDLVRDGLASFPAATLADRDTAISLLVAEIVLDATTRHTLERAHRWEVARRDVVTPSPDLSFPRPRGAIPC